MISFQQFLEQEIIDDIEHDVMYNTDDTDAIDAIADQLSDKEMCSLEKECGEEGGE